MVRMCPYRRVLGVGLGAHSAAALLGQMREDSEAEQFAEG